MELDYNAIYVYVVDAETIRVIEGSNIYTVKKDGEVFRIYDRFVQLKIPKPGLMVRLSRWLGRNKPD